MRSLGLGSLCLSSVIVLKCGFWTTSSSPWEPVRNAGPRASPQMLCCAVLCAESLSPVRLLATPWTAAYQARPFMGFSRQEYWKMMVSMLKPSLLFSPQYTDSSLSLISWILGTELTMKVTGRVCFPEYPILYLWSEDVLILWNSSKAWHEIMYVGQLVGDSKRITQTE